MLPFAAALSRLSFQPARASGTRSSRRLMTPQSSSVAVGIRSKQPRISCSGEAMTLRAISSSPARGSRRRGRGARASAARVTRSTSSTGVARVELGEGVGAQRGMGLVAGGGEVVELLLVAGDAEVGRGDRAEGDELREVVVGDAVDVGGGAGRCRGVSCSRERTYPSALTAAPGYAPMPAPLCRCRLPRLVPWLHTCCPSTSGGSEPSTAKNVGVTGIASGGGLGPPACPRPQARGPGQRARGRLPR